MPGVDVASAGKLSVLPACSDAENATNLYVSWTGLMTMGNSVCAASTAEQPF
jgi:hypothetical protein